jgi:hypothetical protein
MSWPEAFALSVEYLAILGMVIGTFWFIINVDKNK